MLPEIIRKVSEIDIEYKPALVILIAIVSVYAGISSLELLEEHEPCESYGHRSDGYGLCGDYGKRIMALRTFEYTLEIKEARHDVPLTILKLSEDYLGDARIIPFISSILLIFYTFFLTRELSKSNFAALIAVGFLIHSPIFFKYDVSMTYPTFWATALTASFYFAFKNPVGSWFGTILAIGTKVMSIMFIPALFLFVKCSDIPKKRKRKLYILYTTIVGILVAFILYQPTVLHPSWFSFQPTEFLWWLGMWSIEFAGDRVSLFAFFIVLVAIFLLRSAKVPNASAILVVLIVVMFQPAFISGFTEFTNEEYRFLPMVVFISVAVGFVITNIDKVWYELQRFNYSMQFNKSK